MEPPVPPTTIDPSEEVPIQTMPVEILQMTLDLLPFPDLIACLKVCREFRDAIGASKLLSRTLECEEIVTQEREGCGRETTSLEPCPCRECHVARQHPRPIRPLTHPGPIARRLCPLLSNAGVEGMQLEANYNEELEGGYHISKALKFSSSEYFRDVPTWAPVYLTNPPVCAARLRLKFKLFCCDSEVHQGHEMRRTLPTFVIGEKGGGLTLGHLVRSTMEAMGLSPEIEVAASSSPEMLPRKRFLIYPSEWVQQKWTPEMLTWLGPLRVELSDQCWVQLMTPREHIHAECISKELKNRDAQRAFFSLTGMVAVHMEAGVRQSRSMSRVQLSERLTP